ncbi:MAG: PRC-barrel domain-containing protein [Candidatus Peregrinibacteria bacterium]
MVLFYQMHVRFSTCRSLPVVEECSDEIVARIAGIVLQGDSGRVEGFFVRVPTFIGSHVLFCASMDIRRFSTVVTIRDREVLSNIEDHLRIHALLDEKRPVLGQRIVTESGKRLGRCRDVQFDTETMQVSWIFPRRFFRFGIAIPVSAIVRVTQEAVIVLDRPRTEEEQSAAAFPVVIPGLQEGAG